MVKIPTVGTIKTLPNFMIMKSEDGTFMVVSKSEKYWPEILTELKVQGGVPATFDHYELWKITPLVIQKQKQEEK